jgi:hypothetical protein
MKLAGNVACRVEMRNAYNILVGKREGKRPFENPGVDSNIILESFLGK